MADTRVTNSHVDASDGDVESEVACALLLFPHELLAHIAELLGNWHDVAALSRTCKHLRWMVGEVLRCPDFPRRMRSPWVCLTDPDKVRASSITTANHWWYWWRPICVTSSWELLDWLGSHAVVGLKDEDIWDNLCYCCEREDGIIGFKWALKRVGRPFHRPTAEEIRDYVRKPGCAEILACIVDEMHFKIDFQDQLRHAVHVHTVEFLAERGARLVSPQGSECLVGAAREKQVDTVELLLDAGVSPNCTIRGGYTPLHWSKDRDTIQLLVSRGADLEIAAGLGFTPIVAAARAGRYEAMLAFHELGANLYGRKDGGGRDILHIAISSGNPDIVEALLSWGVDPNSRNGWGHYALHVAVNNRQSPERIEIVKSLLRHGADPNQGLRDDPDYTARRMAVGTRWEPEVLDELFGPVPDDPADDQ